MALRLAAAFKSRPELWIELQAQYDLWQASKAQCVKIVPIEQKAA
jgi:plasmid maintenance system antidote protein VapI